MEIGFVVDQMLGWAAERPSGQKETDACKK
jgi:hypothetical protein